jgi:hypothetical protein
MEVQDLTSKMISHVVVSPMGIQREKGKVSKGIVRLIFKKYMQKLTYAISHGYIVKDRNDIKNIELIISLKYTTLNDYKYYNRKVAGVLIDRSIRPRNSRFFLFHVHIAACDYYNYKNTPTRYMKKKIRQYIEADHKLEIVPQ